MIKSAVVLLGSILVTAAEAAEVYWTDDYNKAIAITLIEKNIDDCSRLKWRVSDEASYKFVVRCTSNGTAWSQYLVVPSMRQVKGPDLSAVDPHPEQSATLSWKLMKDLYDKEKSDEVRARQATPLDVGDRAEVSIPRSMQGDKGKYFLLEKNRVGNIVRALHKRVGVGSVGYTRTETDCHTMRMRELGYSEASPSAIKDNPTDWFDLVPGSSKSDVARFVCK